MSDHLISVTLKGEQALKARVRGVQQALPKALSSGIRAATIFTESLYKRDVLSGQIVARRSGNLSRSTFHEFPSEYRGIIGWGREAPYAAGVNDGTRPHEIRGNPLAFVPAAGAIRASAFVSGRNMNKVLAQNTAFATVVHHPGTAPTNFVRLGLAMATPEIRHIVSDRVIAAIGKGKSE